MKSGFTLIELLLVVAIISILTAIVTIDYRTAGKKFSLERSANKLAQEMRKTQQMTMSAEQIGLPGAKFYPEGGYGIRFEEPDAGSPLGQAFIFADCDNDHQFTPGNDICNGSFSEKIKDIELEKDIKIKSLFPVSNLDITFKSPGPTIIFFSEKAESLVPEATITISFLENGNTKTVKINKAGLIEAE